MKIKNVLKFIAYSTAFTAIYNKTVAVLATSYNKLKTTDGQFFEWDYGKVYYEKKGEGSPVLLLHDLTADSSGYEWNRVVDKLAENHTVYIPDLLGFGRSDKPGISYSNFLYVKFLTAFIKEVINEPCSIITSGNSSSFAILGSSFLSTYVNQITCINPAGPYGLDQSQSFKDRVINTVLSVPIFGTTLYNHYLSQAKIEDKFANEYFCNCENIKEHVITYHESAHRKLQFARNVYAAERLNYCVLPVKHILSDLKFEMKIIFGAEEESAKDIASLYKELNENISVEYIDESKHLPQLEKYEEVLNILE